jgi:hypothetical protein
MPMDRSLYPDDWEAISLRIRTERAGNKCEQCGLLNGAFIARFKNDPARWVDLANEEDLYLNCEEDLLSSITVVLTVHHIGVDKPDGTPGSPHDKMDCREENLIALCQRCHLLADQPNNIIKGRATRKKHRHEAIDKAYHDAGQLPLFGEME